MLDYLVGKLEGSAMVEPRAKAILGEEESRYLLVGEKGIVVLVDRVYPGNSFEQLIGAARQARPDVAVAFFKDGETFFRSAAEKNYFKMGKDLSLKKYTDEDMQRMMLLRPEEIFVVNMGRSLQYYQPESERLVEEVVSFGFKPVEFDYSHIDSRERFKPRDTESKRLFIWKNRIETWGLIVLDGKYLARRD